MGMTVTDTSTKAISWARGSQLFHRGPNIVDDDILIVVAVGILAVDRQTVPKTPKALPLKSRSSLLLSIQFPYY